MRRRFRTTGWPLVTSPALTVVLIVIALALGFSLAGAINP